MLRSAGISIKQQATKIIIEEKKAILLKRFIEWKRINQFYKKMI